MEGHILHAPAFGGEYKRLFTYADGSCFFHSLAMVLYGKAYQDLDTKLQIQLGHKLRECLFEDDEYRAFLEEHGFLNVPTIVQPHDALEPGIQADEAMINFTAKRLNFNICILVNPTEKYVRDVDNSQPWILIAWINRMHFEPIVYVHDYSTFAVKNELLNISDNHHLLAPDDPLVTWLKK